MPLSTSPCRSRLRDCEIFANLRLNLPTRSVGGTNQGIVFTDGPLYHSQKHFCVKQLRNFGFGKTSLETVMVEQANLLTQHLEANTGKVLVNNELFATPIVNVLWSMMAGMYCGYGYVI